MSRPFNCGCHPALVFGAITISVSRFDFIPTIQIFCQIVDIFVVNFSNLCFAEKAFFVDWLISCFSLISHKSPCKILFIPLERDLFYIYFVFFFFTNWRIDFFFFMIAGDFSHRVSIIGRGIRSARVSTLAS